MERKRVSFDVGWSWRAKVAASLLLALHVMAVFAAPWAAVPPASRLSRRVASVFDPYLQAIYMNHGYRFFAPNPEASHIIRYELDLPDGQKLTGQLPDVLEHTPRLFYHRHLMLAETIFGATSPLADAPPENELTPEDQARLRLERQRVARLIEAIANHLKNRYDAEAVKLSIVEHQIPSPYQILDGVPLDDPSLYREFDLGPFFAQQAE